MQRQTVLVVVVLVTVTLLFFLGVGAGLLQGDGGRASPRDSPPDWVGWMGGLLAPFGPRANLGGLQCAGQPIAEPFRLDRNRSRCEFTFRPTGSERPRRATLEVSPPQASVYVRAEGRPAGREPDPACVRGDLPGGRLVLAVEYTPQGAEPFDEPCWLPVKPSDKRTGAGPARPLEVRFAILKEGGTVALECKGCSDERRLDLAFAP